MRFSASAALLNKIGFDWRPGVEQAWERALTFLDEYRQQYGDPNTMPTGHKTDTGFGLYHWMTRARRLAHDGELTTKQIQQLTDHGVRLTPLRFCKART